MLPTMPIRGLFNNYLHIPDCHRLHEKSPLHNNAIKILGCIPTPSAKGNNYAIAYLTGITAMMLEQNTISWANTNY
jgi:hypothetical protein